MLTEDEQRLLTPEQKAELRAFDKEVERSNDRFWTRTVCIDHHAAENMLVCCAVLTIRRWQMRLQNMEPEKLEKAIKTRPRTVTPR